MRTIQRGSICIAVLLAGSEVRAEDCTPPTPGCHLANGKQLLKSDPKRAATELLASYKLDERTDTLIMYANALELDHQYALAAETWQRIVTYRESELTAAKEAGRPAAIARAKQLSDQAGAALAKLSPKIARVRIRFAAGLKPVVTRDGTEIDASHEVIVNSPHDELVFTRKDGSAEHLVVDVAAGDNVRIDAPEPTKAAPIVAKAEPQKPPTQPVPQRLATTTKPKPEITAKLPPKPVPVVMKTEEPVVATPPMSGEETQRSRTMTRVGMGLVGGAVVLGGVAGSLGYLSGRDFDRARDAGCSANGECTPGRATDLAERSNDRARLAQISAIGAGALLVTGVTLYFVGHKKTHRTSSELTVRVAPSSATVAWRF